MTAGPEAPIAGIDGCRAGWICLLRDPQGTIVTKLLRRTEEIAELVQDVAVVAIDIPIGLADSGARDCDRLARQALGRPRASSVFPAPIRPALRARSRQKASAITAHADGRRVGVQAWAIVPKIREVDALFPRSSELRGRLWEVHPEVSFWAWNGKRAMQASKKTRAGRDERRRLVDGRVGGLVWGAVRASVSRKDVADDDILDAFAALWTAERILRSAAGSFPAAPVHDSAGPGMAITY